jgi:hypothetical protein
MQYDWLGSGYLLAFADPAIMRSGNPSPFMSMEHMALVDIGGEGNEVEMDRFPAPLFKYSRSL